MEQESYSSYEVIVALQNIGISQEIIEYVVPIAGYESRVEGTLFTRDALDKLSPSWGIFQANVDSMAPGIYKAMNELGVDIPGMSDEQKKVLIENKALPGQEEFIDFTEDQKEFVVDWFKNQADLNANALVFKYMLEQKMKDKNTNDFKVAVDAMYPMTVSKFNDLNNEDAQAVKTQISDIVTSFFNDPDRGIPEPEEGFDPTAGMDTTTTTTSTTMPPEETTETETKRVDTSSDYRSQVPKQAGTYLETQYMKRMRRLNHNYRKDQFLKNYDNVTRFKKKDPTQFKERPVVEEDEIKFPFGTPVTSQEVLDLLEP